MLTLKNFFNKTQPQQMTAAQKSESVLNAIEFLETYGDEISQNIKILSHSKDWLALSKTWSYVESWDILTFYRCMTRLKEHAKDTPHAKKAEAQLNKYNDCYEFSKHMWIYLNKTYSSVNTLVPINSKKHNLR